MAEATAPRIDQELTVCPLCRRAASGHALFEAPHWRGIDLQYRICSRCGLVFQTPRPSEQALVEFYDRGYRQLMQGQEDPTEKDRRVQEARAGHLLAFVQRRIAPPKLHLDIGSSTGALLETFAGRFGSRPFGVEPGEAYRRWSQERGLEVFPDLRAAGEGSPGKFDLISMIHVLEHLHQPLEYLQGLRRDYLAQDGHLLIEVPNLFGHRSVEFSHLYLFFERTLRQTLQAAGFETLQTWIHGRPRSRTLGLYLALLARPRPPVAESNPHWRAWDVRMRRRLGMLRMKFFTRLLPGWTWQEV
ncbi:MAG TPA: class I SAM-dependent methyltransferase [Anaerolineales bacterium]